MTNSVQQLEPKFVDTFPSQMSPGVMYVSIRFATCGHLCCCGCGQEVVTPLSPAQWALTYDRETISIRPSIGNWTLECRSHYWIRNNRICWARSFSRDEVARNRVGDRRALEEHIPADDSRRRSSVSSRLRSWLGRG